MKYQFKIHQHGQCYDGFFKFFEYHVSYESFRGGMIENVRRECGKKGDVVAVLPYDSVRQQFIMVEQFRIGLLVRDLHPWNFEIVAGFMDIAGETPEQTAIRETKEETGCDVKHIEKICSYFPGAGGSASMIHLYFAEIDSSQVIEHTGNLDEGEDIRVHVMPYAKLDDMIVDERSQNATAIMALQAFKKKVLE